MVAEAFMPRNSEGVSQVDIKKDTPIMNRMTVDTAIGTGEPDGVAGARRADIGPPAQDRLKEEVLSQIHIVEDTWPEAIGGVAGTLTSLGIGHIVSVRL